MELMHIKLKTGLDLVSYIIDDDGTYITLKDPVQFGFDPNNGIYGLDWLILSDTTSVRLLKSDTYFINNTSSKAIEFYEQFNSKSNSKKEESSDISDLELIFEALMEAKSNTKH